MQKFTNCPVGSFKNISFQYIAGTARKPKEPPKLPVDRCEDSSLVFVNPRPKLLRHLNCMSKKIKVLWGGRPARPEYTI
ncbi:hypothetical protein Q5692_36725 [Microcoleus sp. C2C3]|uniref:hypothetical protein n=1 Tax=unclassified Microcoleus TaxID=2642155 RepID=UPI002FD4B531